MAVFPKNLWITEKATGNLGRLFLPEENRTAKPPVVFYLLENIRRKVRGRFVVNRVEVNARTFSHFSNTGFSRPIQDSVGKPALVNILWYIRPLSASVTAPSLSCMNIVRICVGRESKTLR